MRQARSWCGAMLLVPALCAGAALAAAPPAAKAPAPATLAGPAVSLDQVKFEPGKETRVDDPSVGGAGYYLVHVPKEYTPDRTWPAIFCYHGLNQNPTTWPFTAVLGGKGFIVIGMEYYGTGMDAFSTVSTDIETVRRLAPLLTARLKLDPKQLFIGGFSQGGWMTSTIAEATAGTWAGIAICGAGRQGGATPRDPAALRGKPMYVAAGEKDANLEPARKAADYYRSKGADVAFEMYAGLGHSVDTKSKVFADWLWGTGPLKQAKADLAEAKTLQAAGKLGQAYVRFLKAAAIPGGHDMCIEAAKTGADLAKAAEDQLSAADAAAIGKRYAEAIGQYSKLAAAYDGSPFGERAKKALDGLKADPTVQSTLDAARQNAEARTLAEQAETAELAKDYSRAVRLYEQLVAACPKSDRVESAKSRLAALKSDKTILAAVRNKEAERDCRSWLAMADNFIQADLKDKAREYLQKILEKYPETEWATMAKERMNRLK